MKVFREKDYKQVGLIIAIILCRGVLITPSPLEAQSNKTSISGQTKHSIVDSNIDPLQQISKSMQELSKRVSPSVVQIFSTAYSTESDREHRNTDLLSRGLISGSGIIIASDGWVVTNAHVVQGARRIRIRLGEEAGASALRGGKSRHELFDAQLVVADRDTDLAVLKIEATDLHALELSDSSDLKQGQLVFAFGSPLGLDNSVSMGVVSSVARKLDPDSPTILHVLFFGHRNLIGHGLFAALNFKPRVFTDGERIQTERELMDILNAFLVHR